jgi:hypothetical protein
MPGTFPGIVGTDAVAVVVNHDEQLLDAGDDRKARDASARADCPGRPQRFAAVLAASGGS